MILLSDFPGVSRILDLERERSCESSNSTASDSGVGSSSGGQAETAGETAEWKIIYVPLPG